MYGPPPVSYFRHVLAVLVDVSLMIDQFFTKLLLHVSGARGQTRHPINDIIGQVEPVEIIKHQPVKRARRRSLSLISSNVQLRMIGAGIAKPVNEPGVPMVS